MPTPSDGASPSPAASLKAAYLLRFLSYVEFPAAPAVSGDTALRIGVLGADDVYEALGPLLKGRTVKGRLVQRQRLGDDDSLTGVHLLFAGPDIDLAHHPMVKAARATPVLLVSDAPDGLAHGAVFNFVPQDDRLRFEASIEAASRARLRVSARLLAMAERVRGIH